MDSTNLTFKTHIDFTSNFLKSFKEASVEKRKEKYAQIIEKVHDRREDWEKEFDDYKEKRLRELENTSMEEVAQTLFDNRLGWSEGRQPYAPRQLWADLGSKLYGEDDPRVKELRC